MDQTILGALAISFVSGSVGSLESFKRGHSSVAEHSTADREVTGSNPVAPSRPLQGFPFPTHRIQVDGANEKRDLW